MADSRQFARDLSLEQQFAKQIKSILGCYFITQSSEADLQQATDFAVFTVKPFKVGVRLRRYDYWCRYPREFTIRWSRPSGVPTEIDKIRQGLVDYIMYGFVSEDGSRIIQYFIGDLAVFRRVNATPDCVQPNSPHDSDLAAYRLDRFPPAFVVKWWQAATDRAV